MTTPEHILQAPTPDDYTPTPTAGENENEKENEELSPSHHPAPPLSKTNNPDAINSTELMGYELSTAEITPLHEGLVVKYPKYVLIGWRRERYLVLCLKTKNKRKEIVVNYYASEFAYTSFKDPLGFITLLPTTEIKSKKNFRGEWEILIWSRTSDLLVIACKTEDDQKKWELELIKSIAYLKHLVNHRGFYHYGPEKNKRGGRFSSSVDKDININDADDINISDTEMGTSSDGDLLNRDMDSMSFGDMINTLDRANGYGRSSRFTGNEIDDEDSADLEDIQIFPGESRSPSISKRPSSAASPTLKVDFDINDLNTDNAHDSLKKYKNKLADATNPIMRFKAKKKLSKMEHAVKVQKNWVKIIVKWTLINISRSGEVPRVKRFLESLPSNSYFEALLKNEGIFENMARSAVRFKHKSLLDYMILKKNVDVNCQNRIGFPLILFCVTARGVFDNGQMLKYMVEDLGADPLIKNSLGQNILFFCTVLSSGDNSLFYCKILVETYGLDPRQVDKFGCSVLHFAVLYSKLEVCQYWYDQGWAVRTTARWMQELDILDSIGFMPTSLMQARNGWRARGLIKYANSASPLAVAILHNDGRMAKFLMGMGSKEKNCEMRKGLFVDNCRDLEMVSVSWPELLPDVLLSFAYTKDSFQGGVARKEAGGFTQVEYAISEIIGDPSQPVSSSPLAIFCRTGHPGIFEVPIVELMIRLKWTTFGRAKYINHMIPYLIILVFFWIGAVNDSRVCRLIALIPIIYALLIEELLEFCLEGPKNYLSSIWNYLSTPSYIAMLVIIYRRDILEYYFDQNDKHYDYAWEDGEDQTSDSLVLAFAVFCLILRSLEFLIILPSTSVFVNTVVILIKDILTWGVLFLLFLVAYASAFNLLLRGEDGFESFWDSLVLAFRMSISGEADMPFSANVNRNTAGIVLYISFSFLVTLLYLNVLIAIMTKSFSRIENQAGGMSALALAKSIVTWEATLHPEHRKAAHERMFPPGAQKPVNMTLSTGLGLDLNHVLARMSHPFSGGGKHVTEDDMQVAIEHGKLTAFAKAERSWKQLEHEDEVEWGAEIQDIKAVVHAVKDQLTDNMERMQTKVTERMEAMMRDITFMIKDVEGYKMPPVQEGSEGGEMEMERPSNPYTDHLEEEMEDYVKRRRSITKIDQLAKASEIKIKAEKDRKRDIALDALEAMGVSQTDLKYRWKSSAAKEGVFLTDKDDDNFSKTESSKER